MNLLHRVVRAAYCRSTHHYLVLDALAHLRGKDAEGWQNLFLTRYQPLLEGAKDPDKQFKDFENHVLHVRDGYWGGAREAAQRWYHGTVRALESGAWELAAYNAGVLSHYVVDPVMPFHTGQSKEETNLHRAAEWTVAKSYESLYTLASERVGFPQLETGRQDDWLQEMVMAGAEIANGYYESLIEHFDFAKATKKPEDGLDETGREFMAQLLGFACVSTTRILERAIEESGAKPPRTHPGLKGFFTGLDMPIAWVARRMADAGEARLIERQYREWAATGSVSKHLSEDVRKIRDLVNARPAAPSAAPETPVVVPVVPVVPGVPFTNPSRTETSSLFGNETPRLHWRGGLGPDSPVGEAPSIGPKTAERLATVGILTLGDLLAADPEKTAESLQSGYITAEAIRDWQDQTSLVAEIPQLRGHDAQILVHSGYRSPRAVAAAQPEEMLADIRPFLESELGKRLIESSQAPDHREVTRWIGWAEEACPLGASDEDESTQTGRGAPAGRSEAAIESVVLSS